MRVSGSPGNGEEQRKAELEGNEEEQAVPESRLPEMKPLPSTSGTQSFAESVIARKKAEEMARMAEEETEKEKEPEKEVEPEQEPMDEGPMDPKEAAGKYILNSTRIKLGLF